MAATHPSYPIEYDDVQLLLGDGVDQFANTRYLLVHGDDAATLKGVLNAVRGHVHPMSNRLRGDSVTIALGISHPGLMKLGVAGLADIPYEFARGLGDNRSNGVFGGQDPGREAWRWGRSGDIPDLLIAIFYADQSPDGLLELPVTAPPLCIDARRSESEPFGFRDGISNPVFDPRKTSELTQQRIATGEILLGYPNERKTFSRSPTVPRSQVSKNLDVVQAPNGELRANLGANGSFAAFMQLDQNTRVFEHYSASLARSSEDGDLPPGSDAALLMGRQKGGAPLIPLGPGDDGRQPDMNAFGYAETDPHGFSCPVGAHVRRSNPRDSLLGEGDETRNISAQHQILRRGRPYQSQSGDETGLAFLCFNAQPRRQFEFIMQRWIHGERFGGLWGESDPLLGHQRSMTIRSRERVLADRIQLPDFVTNRGSGYFFFPGLRALEFLST